MVERVREPMLILMILVLVGLFVMVEITEFGPQNRVGLAIEVGSQSLIDSQKIRVLSTTQPTQGAVFSGMQHFVTSKQDVTLLLEGYDQEQLTEISTNLVEMRTENLVEKFSLTDNQLRITFTDEFGQGRLVSDESGLWILKNTNTYIVEFKEEPLINVVEKTNTPGSTLLTGNSVKGFDSPEAYRKHLRDLQNSQVVSLGREVYKELPDSDKITQLKSFNTAINAVVLKLSPAQAKVIGEQPNVKAIHPNREYRVLLDSSVDFVGARAVWNLDANGNDCLTSGQECLTGKGIKVAIIDTGVDYTHEDFGGCTVSEFQSGTCAKVAGGYDFVNNDADPMDDHGHGTHVAATVSGEPGPANAQLTGVAPDAVIYAYKVLDAGGSGYSSEIISGVEQAVLDGVDIISMSLGGFGDPTDPMSVASSNAMRSGVLTIVAAGNSGPMLETVGSPGVAPEVLTVGALDQKISPPQMTYFSSRGPVKWDSSLTNKPDIVAPGYRICAARLPGAFSSDPDCGTDNTRTRISGTSMATPIVSGVAALIMQAHTNLSSFELKERLMATASSLNFSVYEQGAGYVNATTAIGAEYDIEGNLDFGSNYTGTKSFSIKNTGTNPITARIEVPPTYNVDEDSEFSVVRVSESSFNLQAGEEKIIDVTTNVSVDMGGTYIGNLNVYLDNHFVGKPYSFMLLGELEINIPEEHYPTVFLIRKDFKNAYRVADSFALVGTQVSGMFPPGDYYVLGAGDFFDPTKPESFPEKREYVFLEETSISVDNKATVTFDERDLKPYRIQTTDVNDNELLLTSWLRTMALYENTIGFCPHMAQTCETSTTHTCRRSSTGICRDVAFTYSMSMDLSTPYDEKTIYLSDTLPGVNFDVHLTYGGFPE